MFALEQLLLPFGESFSMKRINHQEADCEGRACTNGTEEFFSMRRTEIGRHHHIAAIAANATSNGDGAVLARGV